MPRIQRFLLQKLGTQPGIAVVSLVDALLWLFLKVDHKAFLLPCPVLEQRIMEDALSNELIEQKFPKRLQRVGDHFIPEILQSEIFLGPCEFLDFLTIGSWSICCYGFLGLETDMDSNSAGRSLTARLSDRWQITLRPEDCVVEDGRRWIVSPEEQHQEKATHFGCCFKASGAKAM